MFGSGFRGFGGGASEANDEKEKEVDSTSLY